MFQQILIPLDGSTQAESVLPIAARIARFTKGSLVLLRAVLPPIEVSWHLIESTPLIREVLDEEVERAATYLQHVSQSSNLAGIPVTTDLHCAEPVDAIPSAVPSHTIDLILMSSRGYSGVKRLVLGSVARSVVRHCCVPVLIVPEGSRFPAALQAGTPHPVRILVALDLSPHAEAILPPAAYLSAALSAPEQGALHLVHILPISSAFDYGQEDSVAEQLRQETPKAAAYLQQVAQRLQTGDLAHLHLQTTTAVEHDRNTAEALIYEAESTWGKQACDMLALATHGRSGWQLLLKGSVAERLFGASHSPVLLQRVED